MSIFAIDANIPISFVQAGIWDIFEEYVKKSNHSVVMPVEVYEEARDLKTRTKLQQSDFIQRIKVDEASFQTVKSDCISINKTVIQDNDYKLITSAFNKNANYLVSNDFNLNKKATLYFQKHQNKMVGTKVISPPGLFWLMYLERKDVFDLGINIRTNLEYYSIIEIDRMYKEVVNDKWDYGDCLSLFKMYSNHIQLAILDHTK